MKHEAKTPDAIKAMGDASAKIQSRSFKLIIIKSGAVIALAIVFVIFVLGGEAHKTTLKHHHVAEKRLEQASIQLQQNLKKLKSMSIQADQSAIGGTNKASVDVGFSQAMMARMRAPTSMSSSDGANQNPLQSMLTVAKKTMTEAIQPAKSPLHTIDDEKISASKIEYPDYTVAAGELIHGVLMVASNSDLPGMVSAMVSQPVYSYTGKTPLIPAGSRLIGQYSSAVTHGQDRLFIIWNRILLPSGITIQIDSPSTDSIGQSGTAADSINRHFWDRFGQATLLSILGASTATVGVDGDDQYNSASAYRSAIAESLQASADDALQDSVGIKPTLKAHQGQKINVFIAHDLDFYSVRDDLPWV